MTDWLSGFREEIKQIREDNKQIRKEVERLRKENEALRSITPKKLLDRMPSLLLMEAIK